MLSKKFQFTFFVLANLLLVSCKKEQPKLTDLKANCGCENEVSADFLIEEMTTTYEPRLKYTVTDSIFGDKNVRFRALEKNAQYKWYIGSEILSEGSFSRFFSNSLVGQTIPITLVVKRKPNSTCFPDDDGYDSITKYMTVAKENWYDDFDSLRFCGTFKVKSPLFSDSILLRIESVMRPNGRFFDFYNYDGKGSNYIKIITSGYTSCNYKQFFINDQNFIPSLYGNVFVHQDNKAELNLISGDSINGKYVKDAHIWNYRGRKIN